MAEIDEVEHDRSTVKDERSTLQIDKFYSLLTTFLHCWHEFFIVVNLTDHAVKLEGSSQSTSVGREGHRSLVIKAYANIGSTTEKPVQHHIFPTCQKHASHQCVHHGTSISESLVVHNTCKLPACWILEPRTLSLAKSRTTKAGSAPHSSGGPYGPRGVMGQ